MQNINKMITPIFILLLVLSDVEGRGQSRPRRPRRPGRRTLKNSRSGAFEFAVDNEGMPDTRSDFGAAGISKAASFVVAGDSKGFARSHSYPKGRSQSFPIVSGELGILC